MTFGERIAQRRKELSISQRDLAAQLGITPTRLNYWEKDKREPDVEMIKALSKALLIPADVLIGNVNEATDVYLKEEISLVKAYRAADPIYQQVAMDILVAHPADQSKDRLA